MVNGKGSKHAAMTADEELLCCLASATARCGVCRNKGRWCPRMREPSASATLSLVTTSHAQFAESAGRPCSSASGCCRRQFGIR